MKSELPKQPTAVLCSLGGLDTVSFDNRVHDKDQLIHILAIAAHVHSEIQNFKPAQGSSKFRLGGLQCTCRYGELQQDA